MINKNSIFVKILIPVTAILLIQTLLISLVLFVNGTVETLETGAIKALSKNAENRRITLENAMVHNWSNIDKLEIDVQTEIYYFLNERNLTLGEALGEHVNELLFNISDSLISSMRLTLSTGTFIYFCDTDTYDNNRNFSGLYYRDLDPVATPNDYSDILYLRGPVDIARKHKIQLDRLWNEVFTFSPDYKKAWESYANPITAVTNNVNHNISTSNMSYWSEPHYISNNTVKDSNECITYTRPLYFRDNFIGIIGIEVQTDWLKKYFPANDFDNEGMGGYMLVTYDTLEHEKGTLTCKVQSLTGSYMKRLINEDNTVTLNNGYNSSTYSVIGDNGETAQVSLQNIKLYNENTHFSNIKWALASIETNNHIFSSASSLKKGIIFSSSIALFVGTTLLAFIIRLTTRPLISISHQIEASEIDDPIIISKSNTHEIVLLCDTINAMRDKRRQVEFQLRAEKERCIIALESVTDTFMEYDLSNDTFMAYFITTENKKPVLSSMTLNNVTDMLSKGEICHIKDIANLTKFLKGEIKESIEVRFRKELLPHMFEVRSSEYLWFLLRASYVHDDSGEIAKVIGTAKHITEDKLKELELLEASYRDPTTKFFNRDYGMKLIKKMILPFDLNVHKFAVLTVLLNGIDTIEAYFGRIFGGIVIRSFSREINKIINENDIIVRSENDVFIFYLPLVDKNDIILKASKINQALNKLYIGENPDIKLEAHIGASLSEEMKENTEEEFVLLLEKSYDMAFSSHKDINNNLTFSADETTILQSMSKRPVKPISIALDITKEQVLGFFLEAFELSTDIPSIINSLLGLLCELFELNHIIICSHSIDFGTNHVSYQWIEPPMKPYHTNIEKISQEDFKELNLLLDEDGVMIFDTDTIKDKTQGLKKLLCISDEEVFSELGCVMYENGLHTGMILYKTNDITRTWNDSEKYCLNELAKMFSAHISIQKSHTASKAKSEFLSRMSHEIRTPMNAIIGMTGIAKDFINDKQRVTDCLNKIDFSSKHLLSLINDILDMSRIESGKLKIEDAPFSLQTLCNSLDMLMRPPIESKNINFIIENDFNYNNVFGDEYRLRQVLVNLIGNANKFTEFNGKIILSIKELDKTSDETCTFLFSVKDNGIGIDKEDQMKIFTAFEQADSSSTRKSLSGTGLGLAISSNIVSAMGSKIEVISNIGEGSQFFFILDMKLNLQQDADNTTETNAIDYKGKFIGKRVLLVEDNEINTEIAVCLLESVGFTIENAVNGQEAVDMFNNSENAYYDAILMDIQMPIMDGLTATRQIRKNHDRQDAQKVPIIAMTANAFDEDMKKSIQSGMNGHIAKPIDTNKLFGLLKELIGFSQ